MDKFKEIIENKNQKSNRKPRYGTRKLSIGLVSCVLGYAMLISPSVALADEVNETETTVEESAVPTNTPAEENTEETEAPTPTEENTPEVENQPTETSEEKSQDTVSGATPKEEATSESEKSNEEEPEKKLVTLDEYKALQEENAEANAGAEELEISEEADPVALQAGETEESAITNVEITIGGAKNGENTTIVNPTSGTDRIDTTDTDLN